LAAPTTEWSASAIMAASISSGVEGAEYTTSAGMDNSSVITINKTKEALTVNILVLLNMMYSP